jgi:hypothetical protein
MQYCWWVGSDAFGCGNTKQLVGMAGREERVAVQRTIGTPLQKVGEFLVQPSSQSVSRTWVMLPQQLVVVQAWLLLSMTELVSSSATHT